MASVFMLSQKSRSLFEKIIKLDRLSVAFNQKYVSINPRYTQYVLIYTTSVSRERTGSNQGKTFQERKEWPAANIWKRMNFSDRDRFYPQKESFQEQFDTLKGASYTPVHFYYLMALRDPTEPWTESVACDVLRLLTNCKFGFMIQERLAWVNYIKDQVKKNGPVPSPVQSLTLVCYLYLNHDFDPVDILNEMEESGQEPKQDVLAKLMKKYIYLRDLPAARSIFDHIREESSPSPESLSAMIMGHTMAGRRHEVRSLEDQLKTRIQNNLWFSLDLPIIMGYILGGDYDNATKVGSSFSEETGKIFPLLDMIELCSFLKLDKGIDVLIDIIRKGGYETFYNTSTPALSALILNGYNEKAYELFSLLKDPSGHIFFKCAVRGEMPPDVAFQYSKRMEGQGLRNTSFDSYLNSIHLVRDKYALQKQCLQFFKQKGLILRPQDLWQQICHIRDDGTLEDLKGILPLYMLDETTEDQFLFPCLERFKVKLEEISHLFEENSSLNKDEIKYLNYEYAIYLRQKESALDVIDAGFQMKNVRIDQITKVHLKADLKWRFQGDSRIEKFLDVMEGGIGNLRSQSLQMLKKENATRQEVLQLVTNLMKQKLFKAPAAEHCTVGGALVRNFGLFHIHRDSREHYKINLLKVMVMALPSALWCKDGKNLLFEAKLEPFESSRGTPAKCTLFNYTSSYDMSRYNMSILIRRQFLNTGSDDVDTRLWQIKFVNEVMCNFLDNIEDRNDPNSYVQFLLLFLKEEDNLALAIYNMVILLLKTSKSGVLMEVLSLPSLTKNYADTSAVSLALAFLEQGSEQKASAALQKCTIPYMTYLRFINLLAALDKIDVLHGLYSIASAQMTDPDQIKDMLSIIQMYTAKSRGEKAGEEFYNKHLEDLKTLQQEGL